MGAHLWSNSGYWYIIPVSIGGNIGFHLVVKTFFMIFISWLLIKDNPIHWIVYVICNSLSVSFVTIWATSGCGKQCKRRRFLMWSVSLIGSLPNFIGPMTTISFFVLLCNDFWTSWDWDYVITCYFHLFSKWFVLQVGVWWFGLLLNLCCAASCASIPNPSYCMTCMTMFCKDLIHLIYFNLQVPVWMKVLGTHEVKSITCCTIQFFSSQ